MDPLKEWAMLCLFAPVGPPLDALPATYPWRQYLQGVNETDAYYAILSPVRGALFTGPAGNGRHTQAIAFAYSLLKNSLMIPGSAQKAVFALLDTSTLSADHTEKELTDHVNALYDALEERLALRSLEAVAVIFDQLDLYPKSMMDAAADRIENMEHDNCFTVCIAEDEAKVSRKLRRQLLTCRCPMPDSRQRKVYLEQELTITITDKWTDERSYQKKKLSIDFVDIGLEEIVELTADCTYADLADLVRLFKLLVSGKEVSQLRGQGNLVVRLSRADVLDAIGLCKPIAAALPAAPQVIAAPYTLVQQNPGAVPATAAPAPSLSGKSLDNLSFDEGLELIAGFER